MQPEFTPCYRCRYCGTDFLKVTPARARWLQDLNQGLVTVHTTTVDATYVGGTVDDVWYPQHPDWRATAWITHARDYWQASRRGTRTRRIAVLTRHGREALQHGRLSGFLQQESA